MYALQKQGLLGNHALCFGDVNEAVAWGKIHPANQFMIRTTRPGGICLPDIPWMDLYHKTTAISTHHGYRQDEFIYTPMFPDHLLRLQGYVYRTIHGLHLEYATTPGVVMREAMKHPKVAVGLRASILMQVNMNYADWEEINWLLDQYPDAIVEFTSYSVFVGSLPGRNTVVWEVRNY